MSGEVANEQKYLGLPLEEYPEPCQTCERLASFVQLSGDLDLTNPPLYMMPEAARYRQVARMVFPYLDRCDVDTCGLHTARALHAGTNLE